MRRALVVAGLLALLPMTAMAFEESEVANGALAGTMTWPVQSSSESPEPVPVALILAGSGPVDRDGNLPQARSDSLKLLAHALAGRGIASLRIDKRGIGASRAAAAREQELRFDTYVEDAANWVDLLRRDRRIGRVFLIGHSEGALVATRAARRRAVSGLVLIAGAGAPAAEIIARQLAEADLPADLQARAGEIAAALVRQKPVAEVPPALAVLYRPSVQSYLMSWLPLDPAAELAQVQAPVLIIQGTHDLQVTPDDARRLAAARLDARLVLVEGMNHVLKSATRDRTGNLATYDAPNLPLAAPLPSAIAAFIYAP